MVKFRKYIEMKVQQRQQVSLKKGVANRLSAAQAEHLDADIFARDMSGGLGSTVVK